ncbi:hypothetical protein NKH34_30825 [Mesorhizobium sp. M1148]|uniref:NAD(P)-dependent oxidoreductase n=1 Tax=unclassified Mesorhizobium TaxID=325217 RepID=UPI001FD9C1DC|nr:MULTISPECIES: NAD(P)-dependent oxidoreductase [unclassified Mesorhizobium]WJI72275.1 hypothetical protein NLY36_16890 [Mesorhizobium sp. C399B]
MLVSSTPNDFRIFTVSEHAVALMLAVAKQLGTWTPEFMRRGGWRGLTHGAAPPSASSASAAAAVAWRNGFRLGDPHPCLRSLPEGSASVELVDFSTLVEQSDFLTLHATPSPDNHHILNAAAFSKMKPSAIVVNTGRGSLIDYTALRAALANGQIAGAALDVFDQQPPKTDDPLFSLPNVLCTPHVVAMNDRVEDRLLSGVY